MLKSEPFTSKLPAGWTKRTFGYRPESACLEGTSTLLTKYTFRRTTGRHHAVNSFVDKAYDIFGGHRGYTTIKGALANLGHTVARETVRNILKERGIEPAPERSKRTPWSTFLMAHWGSIAAADLLTVEV